MPFQHPVRHMDDIAPGEPKGVHAKKAIAGRQGRVLPMVASVKGNRLARFLNHGVEATYIHSRGRAYTALMSR